MRGQQEEQRRVTQRQKVEAARLNAAACLAASEEKALHQLQLSPQRVTDRTAQQGSGVTRPVNAWPNWSLGPGFTSTRLMEKILTHVWSCCDRSAPSKGPDQEGLCCVQGPSVGPTSSPVPPTVTAGGLLISSDLSIHPFSSMNPQMEEGNPDFPLTRSSWGTLRHSRAQNHSGEFCSTFLQSFYDVLLSSHFPSNVLQESTKLLFTSNVDQQRNKPYLSR